MFSIPHPTVLWSIAGLAAALTTGTIARLTALRGKPADLVQKRIGSLKVWWVLAGALSLAMVLGFPGAVVLLAIGGILALREYARLVARGEPDRAVLSLSCGLLVIHYLLILMDWRTAALVFIPVVALLLLSVLRTLSGQVKGFLRITSGFHQSLLLLVYLPSHAALLFTLPEHASAAIGPVGWFLFLLVLTEMNDIAQALVGRKIGRHRIVPEVSPNKTWEGFAGGIVTTVLLAVLLAPWLTPVSSLSITGLSPTVSSYGFAVVAGLVIAAAGFLGDINMSAVKRDVGVKDGSSLLPGQGGAIDRIDSLTFTAPAFYWLVYAVFT